MAETARKYTPRAKKAQASPSQIPMVVEVQGQPVEFDESDPKVQEDRESAALGPIVLADAIAQFASAVGMVEALAEQGKHELIMQLARIAYTRGRQVARAAGIEPDNGGS